MTATTELTWKHFPAGEHGFFRAPVLISGTREAVLIDGGFIPATIWWHSRKNCAKPPIAAR